MDKFEDNEDYKSIENRRRAEEESRQWRENEKKSPVNMIISGVIITMLFSFVMLRTDIPFFIFPVIFAGIFPIVQGVKRLMTWKYRKDKQIQYEKNPGYPTAYEEKQILKAAKDEDGIVTPAIIALKTEINMEKAEKLLGEMAKKGYASMNVTTEGRVQYIFPDFITAEKRKEIESDF